MRAGSSQTTCGLWARRSWCSWERACMRRRRRLRSRSAPVRLSSASARRSSAHASSDVTATCLQAPACVSSYVGARARIGAPGQAGCLLLHSGKARVWQRTAALPHAAAAPQPLLPYARRPFAAAAAGDAHPGGRAGDARAREHRGHRQPGARVRLRSGQVQLYQAL